jgi:hypothetical protein
MGNSQWANACGAIGNAQNLGLQIAGCKLPIAY